MKSTAEVPALFPDKGQQIAAASSPAEIIRAAVSGGSSLENLEKLLELQERWESNEAKKAYHVAMAAFKQNPPSIDKDRRVAFDSTKYRHASLANVTTKINKELSKHGLSASWKAAQSAGQVSVTCKITHIQGHSEEMTLMAPADSSGKKNAIQSIGSTITYLERYSLLALTGLATHEIDDDGNSVIERISQEEVSTIMDHLTDMGTPVDKFLEYMKLEKLEDMPKSDLKKAQAAIENARARKAKK